MSFKWKKKIDVKKRGRGNQRHQLGSCPQVPVLCMKQCHRGLHGKVIEISPMRPEHFYTNRNDNVTNLWHLVYH
jgi:hypothetical protein